MNQLHPYSSAIYLNKKEKKTYTGVFDEAFGKIYSTVISIVKQYHKIDGVCSVPVKPNKENRFKRILDIISSDCRIENIGLDFTCIKSYPDQKGLSAEEREKNIKGVFKYAGDLSGKTVILIDDIVTTGGTIRECVRELRNAGVEEVIVVVMAINQLGSSYWNTELPKVSCPSCGYKMTLNINRKGEFFYSCIDCYKRDRSNSTLGFLFAWDTFLKEENIKLTKARSKDIDKWLEDCFD